MDTESVRSGYSQRSHRSHVSSHAGGATRSEGGRRVSRRSRQVNVDPDSDQAQLTAVAQEDWPDNNTVITAVTSETGYSVDEYKLTRDFEDSAQSRFRCARYLPTLAGCFVSLVAWLSPIAMLCIPYLPIVGWRVAECGLPCESVLLTLSVKLICLLAAYWLIFVRMPSATLPRILLFRASLIFVIMLLLFGFWLFYGVRVFQEKEENFSHILMCADNLTNILLLLHYVAVIGIYLRASGQTFSLRVTRSPDGEMRYYTCGATSIQQAAALVLENYYRDFNAYNPFLETAPHRKSARNAPSKTYKFYDLEGLNTPGGGGTQIAPGSRGGSLKAVSQGGGRRGHNDRFYAEEDFERRVKKRRARLVVAAEEAFAQVRRIQQEFGSGRVVMDATEAAQAIFPALARHLTKFLRSTRQQLRFTTESVIDHLAIAIAHDLSAKAFLQRYLQQEPTVHNERDYLPTESWVLICEAGVSRDLSDLRVFQLRQGDISLLVAVRRIPHLNITEEIVDPKRNKFTLTMNSETSV